MSTTPTPVPLMMSQVAVTFDASSLAISTDIPPSEGLLIPAGITMIVLTLSTINGTSEAVFQTAPIQWFAADNPFAPADPPALFVIQRHGDKKVTLLDFNSAPDSHRFNIVVAYEGNTYGSDPMIINEPPASGGTPDDDRPAGRSRAGSRGHKR
ncbi:MAG TPA: hypothetical protein VGS07_15400 [Thermoanaerobaculia bacterium]|jgi:hypothetical protein|nr:hypothetical protein [Thermoanaerobaculia bacterium]